MNRPPEQPTSTPAERPVPPRVETPPPTIGDSHVCFGFRSYHASLIVVGPGRWAWLLVATILLAKRIL